MLEIATLSGSQFPAKTPRKLLEWVRSALTMGPYIFGRPYSTLIAKKPSDAFLAFRVPYPPLQFNVENKKLYFDAPIVSI